jgi:hypothetical protein
MATPTADAHQIDKNLWAFVIWPSSASLPELLRAAYYALVVLLNDNRQLMP